MSLRQPSSCQTGVSTQRLAREALRLLFLGGGREGITGSSSVLGIVKVKFGVERWFLGDVGAQIQFLGIITTGNQTNADTHK